MESKDKIWNFLFEYLLPVHCCQERNSSLLVVVFYWNSCSVYRPDREEIKKLDFVTLHTSYQHSCNRAALPHVC